MVDAPFVLVGVDGQPVDRQSTDYDRLLQDGPPFGDHPVLRTPKGAV